MRTLIILLSFLSIFSCKKAQEKTSTQPASHATIVDKNWNGDVLISDLSFINTIDSSCQLNTTFFDRSEKQIEEDNLKCALSKVKFDYDKLNSINNRITVRKLSSEIVLFIKKSSSKITNDADLGYQATLYVEKNKTISDSIIIYQSLNYSEALTVKTKYYYLNMDNIYLLDVAEDESGASTEKWEHYKINTTGKISLVKQKLFSKDNHMSMGSEPTINFLDIKYQSNGFFIPDNPNPYPTYSYSDKKFGIFSVDFIGKTDEIQRFWSFKNSEGYFSKPDNAENDSQNSKAIKSLIQEKDYYIVASYIPNQFITYIDGKNDEFEPKQNAKTTFYLYENNSWKQIGEVYTSKIPEDILSFESHLIPENQ